MYVEKKNVKFDLKSLKIENFCGHFWWTCEQNIWLLNIALIQSEIRIHHRHVVIKHVDRTNPPGGSLLYNFHSFNLCMSSYCSDSPEKHSCFIIRPAKFINCVQMLQLIVAMLGARCWVGCWGTCNYIFSLYLFKMLCKR